MSSDLLQHGIFGFSDGDTGRYFIRFMDGGDDGDDGGDHCSDDDDVVSCHKTEGSHKLSLAQDGGAGECTEDGDDGGSDAMLVGLQARATVGGGL